MSEYEEDFYRENRELLDARRKALDRLREENESKQGHEPFWMKCPKCGEKMEEIKLLSIMIEQCSGCNGLFFDNGELETLLEISDRRPFFKSIQNTLYN